MNNSEILTFCNMDGKILNFKYNDDKLRDRYILDNNFVHFPLLCNDFMQDYLINKYHISNILKDKSRIILNYLCNDFKYFRTNDIKLHKYNTYSDNLDLLMQIAYSQSLSFVQILSIFLEEPIIQNVPDNEYNVDFFDLYKKKLIDQSIKLELIYEEDTNDSIKIKRTNPEKSDYIVKFDPANTIIDKPNLIKILLDENFNGLITQKIFSVWRNYNYIDLISNMYYFYNLNDNHSNVDNFISKLSLIYKENQIHNLFKYDNRNYFNNISNFTKFWISPRFSKYSDYKKINIAKLPSKQINKLTKVKNNFIRRIIGKRNVWSRTKTGFKLAKGILTNTHIIDLVNEYTKTLDIAIRTYFNDKDIDNSIPNFSEKDKNNYVKMYIISGWTFDYDQIYVDNDYLTKQNILKIYGYVRCLINNSGNIRSKLEYMFNASRILCRTIIPKIFNKIQKNEIDDAKKLCTKYKVSYDYVKERYNVVDGKLTIFKIKDMDKYIQIISESMHTKKHIWEMFLIYANFDYGDFNKERLKLISNSFETNVSKYGIFKKENITPIPDECEFFRKFDSNNILFLDRGIDSYRNRIFFSNKANNTTDYDTIARDYAWGYYTGVSGHATGIMFTARILDVEKTKVKNDDLRIFILGMIGYMVPRKDHTIGEILIASNYYFDGDVKCPEDSKKKSECLVWLHPEEYKFGDNTYKKEDYIKILQENLTFKPGIFLSKEYLVCIGKIIELIGVWSGGRSITQKIKRLNNIGNKELSKIGNLEWKKEMFIIFCIIRRELLDYNSNASQIMWMFDKTNRSISKLLRSDNKLTKNLIDFTIYHYEDEDTTPIGDLSNTLSLNNFSDLRRVCLYFMKHYNRAWKDKSIDVNIPYPLVKIE